MSIDLLPEPAVYLLAVVEVSRDNRILCQVIGCGHSVFKRIHVVKVDGVFQVLGSECFKRLYGQLGRDASTPRYASSDGMRLTDDERLVLIDNTERFIARLEAERLDAEHAEVQRADERRRKDEQHEEKRQRLEKLAVLNKTARNATYVKSQRVSFSNVAGMRWMWARSLDEGRSRIEQYKSGGQRTPEKDLIVRYFVGSLLSDPWVFSLTLKHHHAILEETTLNVLHELALIEPLPAYV